MIVKSMSRKDISFAQLYDYITEGMEGKYDHPNAFIHNFYNTFNNRKEVIKGFTNNVKHIPKRKNGNNLYHEILSVKVNPKIKREKHYTALYDITREYIQMRAGKCLVIGGIHDEHEHHIHMHLMISSNELSSNKRHRLTKKEFSVVKKLTEDKAIALYPELAQEILINTEKKPKKTPKEDKSKKTKKPNIKDHFKARMKDIFAQSVDKQDFYNRLDGAKIKFYARGKTLGFTDIETNKNHRLKTLGLETEFEAINAKLSQVDKTAGDDKTKTSKKTKPQAKTTSNKKAQPKEKDKVTYSLFTGFNGGLREWLLGDFSEREKRINAEKTKQYRKNRKKFIPEEKLTTTDKVKEAINRWAFGNFEDEKARELMKKWQEKHDKEQAEIDNTKSREEQTTIENTIETAKEWLLGDFTNRENRAKKAKQEKDKQAWYEAQQQKQASNQVEKKTEPNSSKSQQINRNKEAIKNAREKSNESKSKDKDLGRSR